MAGSSGRGAESCRGEAAEAGEKLKQFLSQFSGLKVVPVNKMLYTLRFDVPHMLALLETLQKIPNELMEQFIALLESFIVTNPDQDTDAGTDAGTDTDTDPGFSQGFVDPSNGTTSQPPIGADYVIMSSLAFPTAPSGSFKAPSGSFKAPPSGSFQPQSVSSKSSPGSNSRGMFPDLVSQSTPIAVQQQRNQQQKKCDDESNDNQNPFPPQYRQPLVELCVRLAASLRDFQAVELIQHTSLADAHTIVQLCRHLPPSELEAFCDVVDRLSLRELLDMLQLCDEPFAKHCRLCRTQRLQRLEQRMLQGQVPEGLMQVPGTMPLYEAATQNQWRACDELGFSVDPQSGHIYWNNVRSQPVDLVRICDDCLLDVFKAIANQRR